jgi:hypothetical protein
MQFSLKHLGEDLKRDAQRGIELAKQLIAESPLKDEDPTWNVVHDLATWADAVADELANAAALVDGLWDRLKKVERDLPDDVAREFEDALSQLSGRHRRRPKKA